MKKKFIKLFTKNILKNTNFVSYFSFSFLLLKENYIRSYLSQKNFFHPFTFINEIGNQSFESLFAHAHILYKN